MNNLQGNCTLANYNIEAPAAEKWGWQQYSQHR